MAEGLEIYPVTRLEDLLSHLKGGKRGFPPCRAACPDAPLPSTLYDFSQVRGQEGCQAGAGNRCGRRTQRAADRSARFGESMLAKRLPSILPTMSFEEALETTKIHSIAGHLPPDVPF